LSVGERSSGGNKRRALASRLRKTSGTIRERFIGEVGSQQFKITAPSRIEEES